MADALAVFLMVPILCAFNGITYSQPYQISAIIGALFAWVVMGVVDLYRPWRGASVWSEIRILLAGWILILMGLLAVGWMIKFTAVYSRLVMGEWFMAAPVMLILLHLGERMYLRSLRRKGKNTRTAVIVGAGTLGRNLHQKIEGAGWMGVRLEGFFDDDKSKSSKLAGKAPLLGPIEDVVDFVQKHDLDIVYLALPRYAESRMLELFGALQDTTASIYLVPNIYIFELMGSRVEDLGGMPVFALCESPLTGPFGIFKRIEDILLSLFILLLSSPLLLLIAIAVKLSSHGPVLFKQRRYGLGGNEVLVWKFRSMTVCENDERIICQATKNDSRVTTVGAFLRRTSLDELPQFFNVLQGHMSVVGPRPHAVAHNEKYRKVIKGYMWRHKVKPGITGWAQVNGWRGETDTLDKMRKRVEFDLDYIRQWSIRLDLKIVWLTMTRGLTGELNKDAY